MAATIHRVNASGGGVPKLPLAVATLGIAGDEHNFLDGDFNRVAPGRSRVYARVLAPGEIRSGDAITIGEPAAPPEG